MIIEKVNGALAFGGRLDRSRYWGEGAPKENNELLDIKDIPESLRIIALEKWERFVVGIWGEAACMALFAFSAFL